MVEAFADQAAGGEQNPQARLRHNAALDDIDYRSARGLDKGLIQSLAACQWVKEHLNVLITGPAGVGETWLA